MSKTRQEIFDIVARHLLTQRAKSMSNYAGADDAKGCAYRGEQGRKCAAGVLIADAEYELAFEGNTVRDYAVHDALINSGVDMDEPSVEYLVKELQNLHDDSPPIDWHHELKYLARTQSLSPAVLAELSP